jgi:hypothetical protein
MTNGQQHAQSVESKILAAVRRRRRGCVFTPSEFTDFGTREAVDVALHRLTRQGAVRRLVRGVYDYPRMHPVLGALAPPAEAVARALAGRDRTRLQPAGASAANALGLSEQVPAKVVFLTDGPSRTVTIGPTTIQLRRTTPRNMETAGRLSGMLIQALRAVGQDHIEQAHLEHLKRTLPEEERQALLKDLRLAPAWMHPIFRELAGADT